MSINSPVITQVARRLVAELNPEEIIVFSSYTSVQQVAHHVRYQ